MPRTFLFYPAKPELSEKNAFLATCNESPGWTWILKPSDGAKVSARTGHSQPASIHNHNLHNHNPTLFFGQKSP